MDCDLIQEQLEAYALNALEPEERAWVERHLQDCPHCQQVLAEYEEVLAQFPEMLTAVTNDSPPDHIKASLLRAITANRATPVHQQLPRHSRRRLRWHWGWQLATAIFGLLLILSLAWGIRLNVALAQERALRAEVLDLVGQQELVLEVVDSNQTNRSFLRPVDTTSAAYGKLFTRTDMPFLVAMAARLPQPPQGQAYHVWLTHDQQTELAGVMVVDEAGFGLLLHEADQNGPTYDAAELTLQPLGTTAPQGTPVLFWSPDNP